MNILLQLSYHSHKYNQVMWIFWISLAVMAKVVWSPLPCEETLHLSFSPGAAKGFYQTEEGLCAFSKAVLIYFSSLIPPALWMGRSLFIPSNAELWINDGRDVIVIKNKSNKSKRKTSLIMLTWRSSSHWFKLEFLLWCFFLKWSIWIGWQSPLHFMLIYYSVWNVCPCGSFIWCQKQGLFFCLSSMLCWFFPNSQTIWISEALLSQQQILDPAGLWPSTHSPLRRVV